MSQIIKISQVFQNIHQKIFKHKGYLALNYLILIFNLTMLLWFQSRLTSWNFHGG
jgi:hypothetical protein